MSNALQLAFVCQAESNLAQVEQWLGELGVSRGKAQQQVIDHCYRALHTISGLANYLELSLIATLTLRAEQLLEEMRTNPLHDHGSKIETLKRAVKRLSSLVSSLKQGDQPQASTAESKTESSTEKIQGSEEAQEKRQDEQLIKELIAWSSRAHRTPVKRIKRPINQRAPAFYRQCNQSTTGPPLGRILIRIGII
jgi:chemotaxis protein histidine kinase CheA